MKKSHAALSALCGALGLFWGLLPAEVGAEERIKSIRVEGVQWIDEETVKDKLGFQEGSPFDPDMVRSGIQALYQTGFFKDVALEREGTALVVRVVENPMIHKVEFQGYDLFTMEELKELVQSKANSLFNRAKTERDVSAIRQAYRVKGLFLAQVEVETKPLDRNRVDLVYRVKEGEKSKVRVVRMVGNQQISQKELGKKMLIQPTGWLSWLTEDDAYDREKLLHDQEQMRELYLNQGYVRVRVDSSVAELTPDRKAFVVTHTVHEGDRYRFGKINITSDFDEAPMELLTKQLETREGEWYSRDEVRKTIENITDLVGDHGYAFLDVQPDRAINDEKKVVDLNFRVTKGKRVYLNRIEVAGNTRTRDEVVRREMRLVEGDRFSASKIRRSKERLKALGFFENVEITTPQTGADDRVNMLVKVVEKPTGTFSIGAGYSTLDKFMTSASISQNNFLGRGQRVSLGVTLSARTSSFDFSFTEPYFMGKNLSAGVDLYNRESDWRSISGYKQKSFGGAFRLGFPLSEHLRDNLSYNAAHVELSNVESTVSRAIREQAEASPYLQSMISNQLVYNTLDDPFNPNNGHRHRFTTDFSGLGGDVKFVRVIDEHSYYRPLLGKSDLVLHLQGKAGVIDGLGERIPIFERFMLGGTRSIRGFRSSGVGPRTLNSESYGGSHFEQGNVELLFPFPGMGDKGVRGAVFMDVGYLGDLKTLPADVRESGKIRSGAGVGLHWLSPFGPLRFELAVPLQKEDFDQSRVFDFSVGASM
ncbi:MAG: outer membrane protein assembly factor BamA [Magnetococcales bacterium]|nr:outer membrane protein assembly factor BamA [Magnetococcales bacterium]